MDKPFDEFMEYKWTAFLEKFCVQTEEIFQAFGCANEEETFEKIILHGNDGFHDFFKAFHTVVSLLCLVVFLYLRGEGFDLST